MWTKLDDGILDHPKVAQVGLLGFAWFAAGLVYCNRNLTNGFIPWAIALKLAPLEYVDHTEDPDPDQGYRLMKVSLSSGMVGFDTEDVVQKLIASLVTAGLWIEDLEKGGFWVHDFLDYNPSRSKVLKERARVKRWRKERTRNVPVQNKYATRKLSAPAPVVKEQESTKNLSTTPVLTHKLSTGKGLEPIGSIMGRLGGVR